MNRYLEKNVKKIGNKWWYHPQDSNFFESLILISANISYIMPSFLKKSFVTVIDAIGLLFSRINNIFISFFHPWYVLSGIEKQSQKKIRIFYKGPTRSIDVVSAFLKNNSLEIKQLNRIKRKQITNMDESTNYLDFFLRKSDVFFQRYLQKKGFIIIPEHVSFLLDNSLSIDTLLGNVSLDIINDIEKAKRTKYTFEIRDDLETFEFFYFNMYIPFVKWKHKEKGRIASFATIYHLAARGAKILLIKHGSDRIFGGIFLKEKNIMRTYYAGLMKGKFSHLHNGIMALSYYYLIRIAKRYNCQFIDFGTAPPFLNDGLYVYKKKWGMKVIETSPFFSDIFAIKIPKDPSMINQFIATQPVHYLNDEILDVLQEVRQKN